VSACLLVEKWREMEDGCVVRGGVECWFVMIICEEGEIPDVVRQCRMMKGELGEKMVTGTGALNFLMGKQKLWYCCRLTRVGMCAVCGPPFVDREKGGVEYGRVGVVFDVSSKSSWDRLV
jgi:hypothetical protein